jgi:hypothetical protein
MYGIFPSGLSSTYSLKEDIKNDRYQSGQSGFGGIQKILGPLCHLVFGGPALFPSVSKIPAVYSLTGLVSIAGTGLFPQIPQQIGIRMIKQTATEFANETSSTVGIKPNKGKTRNKRYVGIPRFGI